MQIGLQPILKNTKIHLPLEIQVLRCCFAFFLFLGIPKIYNSSRADFALALFLAEFALRNLVFCYILAYAIDFGATHLLFIVLFDCCGSVLGCEQ